MPKRRNKGGAFLFEETAPGDVFTYEDFDDESRMMAHTAAKFVLNEVVPLKEQLEAPDSKNRTNVQLLRRAGELGLLMTEIPEAYGGFAQRLSTAMLVSESACKEPSFSAAMMCHTGIGTLPILLFGTPEQREKYLPKLATGELIGAYALTESGFGSDALGAKTSAVKSEDGQYWILNGSKVFITNAGFADLFSVYAKVDGEHFSAFIVEADAEGLSLGPEEHKMGIKGSSTRELILEDVRIPVENLLGRVGHGHKVALNILNLGRLKLGFSGLATCREILKVCLAYAAERKQFGKTIDSFPLIQRKLSDMALEAYTIESMGYRCTGDIDFAVEGLHGDPENPGYWTERVACVEEYAVEDSMLKVYASEAQARVVDEGVQLFGGYGFIEEYPVCSAYRDARITRLFEGTNEINRMLIPGTILRRALKGKLDLMTPITKLLQDIREDGIHREAASGPLGRERTAVDLLRKWALFGYAVPAHEATTDPDYLTRNQILLEQLADLTMDLYGAESVLLRTLKRIDRVGEARSRIPVLITQVVVYEKLRHAMELVRQICANVAGSDSKAFAKNQRAMARLCYDYGLDTMRLRTALAVHLRERGQYALE